ncbi:efflux RND transporter permease subunit, partial [Acinetobacter baumannii]
YTQANQYRVILEADPTLQKRLQSLNEIYLPSSASSTNGQVPLSAIVKVVERASPLVVTHFGQFPATTVSFNLAKGISLGEGVDAVTKATQ